MCIYIHLINVLLQSISSVSDKMTTNPFQGLPIGQGQNKVTPTGEVVYNAKMHHGLYMKNLASSKSGVSPKYGGQINVNTVSIRACDPLLMKKSSFTKNTKTFDKPQVIAALNGAFKITDKMSELYDEWTWGGIAKTDFQFDPQHYQTTPQTAIPVIKGGPATVINTGPYRIEIADRVYWRFPVYSGRTDKNRTISERIRPELIPERHATHDLINDLHDIFVDDLNVSLDDEGWTDVLVRVKNTILAIMLHGIYAGMRSGYFIANPAYAGPVATSKAMEDEIVQIREQLFRSGGTPLRTLFSKVMTCTTDGAMVDPATIAATEPDRRQLCQQQRLLFKEALLEFGNFNTYCRKNYVGTALSAALASQPFDLHQGPGSD